MKFKNKANPQTLCECKASTRPSLETQDHIMELLLQITTNFIKRMKTQWFDVFKNINKAKKRKPQKKITIELLITNGKAKRMTSKRTKQMER